ncbi:MAG TPA: hypothetical protein VI386_09520, partial [Candidatus Sulfotelmatobacter sp.]
AHGQTSEKEDKTIRATLNLPESIRIEAKTEEQQKHWKKDRAFLIQIVGVLVGAAVATIYVFQLRAMREAVTTARDANKLTEDSVRARLVLTDFDLLHPIVAGQPIVCKFRLKNVGRSLGIYGIEVSAMSSNQLPNGDIPLIVRNVSTPIETGVSVSQTIIDRTIPDQNFIKNIPTGAGLTQSSVTHHIEDPTQTPTAFFYGRLIYESLGKRREQQFCFFLMQVDDAYKALAPPKDSTDTDPRFDFINCSKWNLTREN